MASLTLRNVRKEFSSTIVPVKNVSLTVAEGEFLALLGPSGCGKSTLLRSIAGLEELTSGDVYLEGKAVTSVPPAKRNIAMVFQSYALYPHMTVRENISSPLRLKRLPKLEIQDKVNEVAATLGLSDLLGKKPGALSGGQRQRVAVARALVREPELFLLDEPLSNLDALLREKVRAELVKLFKKQGKPVVYVTHDQTEAMTMADKVAILDQGLVQQIGSPAEIYTKPKNTFVAEFIGSPQMNLLSIKRGSEGFWLDKIELQPPAARAEVILGIRPEHLTLATGTTAPLLTGVLQHIEDHGRDYLLTVSVEDGKYSLRVLAPRAHYQKGERVPLAIQGTPHFFCAATGESLE